MFRLRYEFYALRVVKLINKENIMQAIIPPALHKALFLDRDGVINRDVDFAHLPEQIEFMPGIFEQCRKASAEGFLLIVVTNQSGIGRGLYSEAQFHELMRWMMAQFKKESCPLTAYYFCPHLPEAGCDCRKPKPGMIFQAAREHHIDLAGSVLIGDRQSDVEAGNAAGVGDVRLYWQ